LLLEVARGNADVLPEPAPNVLFLGFGDSSIDFELQVWTTSKVNSPLVLKSDLYFEIFRVFGQQGIEIPFPQRDIHVRSIRAELPLRKQEAGE
jgi:small-conductance mechanosensitive channel